MDTIVSCTTTNDRIVFLYHTLISIAGQSLHPDKVVINISKNSYLFDSGILKLPAFFQNLELNLEVNWVENYGSYRKLLPIINEVSDETIIVTIDDDVIYHPDWFKAIIDLSKNNPTTIVAGRARIIRRNFLGNYLNYDGWNNVSKEKKGIDLLPIGIDGIAYRKNLLNLSILNDKKFLEIAPKSDDLWFKMASYVQGINVLYSPTIAQGNAYILHTLGLQEGNFKRSKRGYYFSKQYSEIKRQVFKYLGINQSNNDYSWDRIIGYFESKKFKVEI